MNIYSFSINHKDTRLKIDILYSRILAFQNHAFIPQMCCTDKCEKPYIIILFYYF